MTLKPLSGKVLIQPDLPDEETTSGLAIVQHWPEEISGTVLAVGPKTDLSVGEWVIFSEFAPRQVLRQDDQKLLVMREADILAAVEYGSTA